MSGNYDTKPSQDPDGIAEPSAHNNREKEEGAPLLSITVARTARFQPLQIAVRLLTSFYIIAKFIVRIYLRLCLGIGGPMLLIFFSSMAMNSYKTLCVADGLLQRWEEEPEVFRDVMKTLLMKIRELATLEEGLGAGEGGKVWATAEEELKVQVRKLVRKTFERLYAGWGGVDRLKAR